MSKQKTLISVDLNPCPIDRAMTLAKQANIDHRFIRGNDIEIDIEPTDLLFIDTWHVYGHLKRELAKHAGKVRKYIIMHDTEVDKWEGESIRAGWNTEDQSKGSGIPEIEIRMGLWPAVIEFLSNHPEYVLHKCFTNNNGLTILRRVNTEQSDSPNLKEPVETNETNETNENNGVISNEMYTDDICMLPETTATTSNSVCGE
jgi:hypothetical protein